MRALGESKNNPGRPYDVLLRRREAGAMLTVVEGNGLRCWRLAGVIYAGPNTSDNPEEAIAGLEIIWARRSDFLLPDGQLDGAAWAMLLRQGSPHRS